MPSAGIDESNANGYFILYPKDCLSFCKEVHQLLCKKFAIRNLGVIITDSTTRPLRWGVSGIAIYSY
ncbi:MAG: coenzyme F420-0:L-glutamate ligase [Candidatus Peribacteria bacterium]|nr:coenzyme F420-0:L-glutamate ligase [Candidatus Peribacteria bacterium]